MKKYTKWLIPALVLLLVAGLAVSLFARAGGAGGGGGSSSDGEGIGVIIYLIVRVLLALPFPANVITAGAIILIAWFIYKKNKQQSILNKLPTGAGSTGKVHGYEDFKKHNPGYNETAFKEKVTKAFHAIQKAWEAQDLSEVRRYLSDGVYQRYNTQFKMMQMLKQKNTIDKVVIKNMYLDKAEVDGLYDIIHVAIHASIVDRFVCELNPALNSGGAEEFVEYWSFIKKRGSAEKDMYSSNSCPNCGGVPEKPLGEISKCEYCGALLNSGEFDWVLSEITQADDYIGTHPKLSKAGNFAERVRHLVQQQEDFAVQLMEDKASNGYLQILTAIALQDPGIMRRFVSDAAYAKLSEQCKGDKVVYNRLYLNDVSLIGIRDDAQKLYLSIAIRSSQQRVVLKGGPNDLSAVPLDSVVMSRTNVLVMMRDVNSVKSEGSLYMHNCPSCGAVAENSLSVRCEYCDNPFNSTSREWIIDNVMTTQEYRDYAQQHSKEFVSQLDADIMDKLYDVRDFALNNVMIMVAADGKFDKGEELFVKEMARKWGYDLKQLGPMFNMAQSGRLAIRMPESRKHQEKIIKLMEKAAMADGNVDPAEQALIDNVRKQFLENTEEQPAEEKAG